MTNRHFWQAVYQVTVPFCVLNQHVSISIVTHTQGLQAQQQPPRKPQRLADLSSLPGLNQSDAYDESPFLTGELAPKKDDDEMRPIRVARPAGEPRAGYDKVDDARRRMRQQAKPATGYEDFGGVYESDAPPRQPHRQNTGYEDFAGVPEPDTKPIRVARAPPQAGYDDASGVMDADMRPIRVQRPPAEAGYEDSSGIIDDSGFAVGQVPPKEAGYGDADGVADRVNLIDRGYGTAEQLEHLDKGYDRAPSKLSLLNFVVLVALSFAPINH